ncbi:MAG: hypothetical protein NC307_00480 [Roseburia sp.]|nr:hypothetical protein [Roseburia sp.]
MSAMAEYGYVSQYVASLFKYANSDLITIKNAVENRVFIDNELKYYGISLQQETFILMYISAGLFKNKNGIYITEQNVYCHIDKLIYRLPINSVKSFDYDAEKGVFSINDSISIKVYQDKRSDEMADHFMQIVKLLQMKSAGEWKEDNQTDSADFEVSDSFSIDGICDSELQQIKECCNNFGVSKYTEGYGHFQA